MDKASKAIRRSGVRLKNISSGHSDLHMVISDLKDMRSTSKALISAQITLWEDLLKWSQIEKNTIIRESLVHFYELNALWAEVQHEFVANLKKFKHKFKIILEGEQHIDKSRSYLYSCEQKDNKIRKEIKKASNKGTIDDVRLLEEKLNDSKEVIKAAQVEVNRKVSEQEAVKLIMLKEGLLNLSEYYLELSEKAVIIFNAQKTVAEGIPDLSDKDIHDIKYTGADKAKRTVLKAKENVLCYKHSVSGPSAPYSPRPQHDSQLAASPPSYSFHDFNSPPSMSYHGDLNNQPSVFHSSPIPSYSIGFEPQCSPPHYDLPPSERYENIDGAIGGLNINQSS